MLRMVCFVIALFLVFSFVIHAIDIDHYHPEAIFGVGLESFFHADNRKWVFILLMLCVTLSLWCIKKYIHTHVLEETTQEDIVPTSVFFYFDISTEKGIIQNILYG